MTELCRHCCYCLFDLSVCYDNCEGICLVWGAWQAIIGQLPSPWPRLYLQKMAAMADLFILTSAGSLLFHCIFVVERLTIESGGNKFLKKGFKVMTNFSIENMHIELDNRLTK